MRWTPFLRVMYPSIKRTEIIKAKIIKLKVLVKVSDKEAIWKNLGDLKVGDKILKKKIWPV